MTQRAGFKNDLLGHKQVHDFDNQLDPEFLANRFAKKDEGRLPPLETILDSKQIASIKTAENKKIEETEKTRRSELSTSGIRRANTFERKDADIIRNNSSAMLRDSMNMKPVQQQERVAPKQDFPTPKEDPSDFRKNQTNFSNILREQERKPEPFTPTAPSPIPKQEKQNNLDWRQVSDLSEATFNKVDGSQSGFAKSTIIPSTNPSNPYMNNKPTTSNTGYSSSGIGQANRTPGVTKPTNSIIREAPEEDNWDDLDAGFNTSGQKRSDPKLKYDPKSSKKSLDFDEGWGDF